ncbi:MAG: glutamate--tRNA ligase [Candidatus Acididesulfobacter guangdongensis]|uniref:Glutamate--tRNA ligase n=1 Tax=Acididesulfobacter guangdongensis TaxID=2597225 RepID=A0A519BF90_ACIG2|nr:MAG: glutamate--tRNA ligase [Candidatus Acididesulfobacter guangdongensis]
MNNNIRVRFAPSPTGHLHIGGLRTALFNYLFAKKNSGKLILRIDDTDIARSKQEYEDSIISDIKWFDIKYDEFYRQSERKDIYEKYLKILEEKDYVYECFCTEEELLRSKELSISLKKPYIYNGRCLHLSGAEKENLRKKLADAGLVPSIRLNMLKLGCEQVEFDDMVHGKVVFNVKLLGDFVLKTSDNRFTYNFASIVDDIDLDITHIIRGEDHISNTPRQILLCKALGIGSPMFAHISLLYGKDGKLMSKRDFNANLEHYKKEGYLPQAVLNYLAITGNTFIVNDECFSDEIFTSFDEMAHYFDIKRTKSSGAIFSEEKLKFVNEKWLQQLNTDDLIYAIKEKFILTEYINLSDINSINISDSINSADTGIENNDTDLENNEADLKIKNNNTNIRNRSIEIFDVINYAEKEYGKERLRCIIDFLKNEYKTVKEIILELDNVFLYKGKYSYLDEEIAELLFENLRGTVGNNPEISDFNEVLIKNTIQKISKENKKNIKDIYENLRMALTGKTNGPSILKIAVLLGKERVLSKLMI